MGDCVARIGRISRDPVCDVGIAAIVAYLRGIELDFLLCKDVDVGVGIAGADLDLVAHGCIGNESISQPSSPIKPCKTHLSTRSKRQAIRRRAPRIGVIVAVEIFHAVPVVVVLGPTRDRHGLLGCGARRPCAAIHGCVGQELNAAVLLGLVAYLKILHDLCLRVAAKTCQRDQTACDGSVDSGGHQIQNVGKGQMVDCNFGFSEQGFEGLGLLIYKWVA